MATDRHQLSATFKNARQSFDQQACFSNPPRFLGSWNGDDLQFRPQTQQQQQQEQAQVQKQQMVLQPYQPVPQVIKQTPPRVDSQTSFVHPLVQQPVQPSQQPQVATPQYTQQFHSYMPNYGPAYAIRRASHPLTHATEIQRQGYSHSLDGRNLVVLNENLYAAPASTSHVDAFAFPTSHSANSSISSASTYANYRHSSASEPSPGGYSSPGDVGDPCSALTIPRQPAVATAAAGSSNAAPILMPGPLPAAQSMMGQFSSRVGSTSVKKHKCKVCEKRFTRPSSLQTHMYSHTGEKPFRCTFKDCGRQFSVVSNLRRHRKVHRVDDRTSPGDEEE